MARKVPLAAAVLLAAAGGAVAATRPAGSATAPVAGTVTVAEMAEAFLEGKLDVLEAGLPTIKEAGLSPADKADLIYIRAAANEARPLWWRQVKAGRTVNIRPVVWGRPMVATFDPTAKNSCETTWNNNKVSFTLNWAYKDMDAPEHAEHGFSKGELTDLGVWNTLGMADGWGLVPPASLGPLNTDAQKNQFLRYLDFRSNITGVYTALPRARRWGLWLYCAAYMQKYAAMTSVNARKAVAVIVMEEIVTKPEKYPSLKLARDLEPTEESVALFLKDKVEHKGWTLAEDKLLREALRTHAMANEMSVWKTGRVSLASGQAVALDPEQDKPLREKRDAWMKAAMAKLPKD